MKAHIDLFSGIGGFSRACHALGIQTEVFCEKDEKCQSFLKRTYPNIPVLPDIREFDGTRWRGRWLLTAGVPCQPASRAGKQRGKADDRWLWPEAIRVISEAKPAWCLLENPPGIGDMGLSGILSDLESQGYEVRVFGIPACAVNAPHIRNRYWIVGHSECSGQQGCVSIGESSRSGQQISEASSQSHMAHSECGTVQRGGECGVVASQGEQTQGERDQWERCGDAVGSGGQGNVADITSEGCQRTNGGSGAPNMPWTDCQGDLADTEINRGRPGLCQGNKKQYRDGLACGHWSDAVWVPCADGKFRRAPDDSFGLVDGLHRSALAALGNSIVPQVAYQVIKAMMEADRAGE